MKPFSGNPASPFVLVGDFLSGDEGPMHSAKKTPLTGSSGLELSRMITEAGFRRSDFYTLNLVDQYVETPESLFLVKPSAARAPKPGSALVQAIQDLHSLLGAHPRSLIISTGNLSLYALSGNLGIEKWRGSQLEFAGTPYLPTYSPSQVLKQWRLRYLAAWDIKRAYKWSQGGCQKPVYNFHIKPSFEEAASYLYDLATYSGPQKKISCDIETRRSMIACVGYADSATSAMCIPFLTKRSAYWDFKEEFELIKLTRYAFANPNLFWIFQNGNYDIQYFDRYWKAHPQIHHDTMIAHHVAWPDMKKSLDFQSSLYCNHHLYWKEDRKEVDESIDETVFWTYNCTDAVRTYEICEAQIPLLDSLSLTRQNAFQHRQSKSLFKVMKRGILRDNSAIPAIDKELEEHQGQQLKRLEYLTGIPLNPKSPKQIGNFLYNDLKLPVRKGKTGNASTAEKILVTIAERNPILRTVIQEILLYRSIGVFRSTFLGMAADTDGRIRTLYNVAGPKTFRYSSSENAFGSGGNLQNIPDGSKKAGLPNVRRLFKPDPGYTIFENDLARADAQCVAWEAEDEVLKEIFRSGEDMHLQNAKDIFGNPFLTKSSRERQLAKTGVHAVNYGTTARTLAIALGITVHEADSFIRKWFRAHPNIKKWHDRVLHEIQTTRSVRNKFGFRMYFFDRIDQCFTEALAWVPQSTVALVVDEFILRLEESKIAQVLLQVHDSAVSQVPTDKFESLLPEIQRLSNVTIPYDDPLVIPMGLKASTVSWGDCEDRAWPT